MKKEIKKAAKMAPVGKQQRIDWRDKIKKTTFIAKKTTPVEPKVKRKYKKRALKDNAE